MEGYIATILMFGGNFAPNGWAFCQGQILSIAQNTALFSLLGTTYGGNGQTTFALPDLRGRTPVGFGQGPGLPDVSLGEISGSESITLSFNNMPSHVHPVTPVIKVSTSNPTTDSPNGSVITVGNIDNYKAPISANGNMAGGSVALGSAGGSQPFGIRQPYLGVSFVICLSGIYPSRN